MLSSLKVWGEGVSILPQDPDDRYPFGIRALFAVICGYWLWVFFPPMQQLHLVTGGRAFIPVLIILVLAQWTPYVWLRVTAGILASEFFVWSYYHSGPADGASVAHLLTMQAHQFGRLLTIHQAADPLQTTLFLFAICVIYWLINYASRRPRLWLFYNGLGILVLAIVAGNTNVRPDAALVSICMITLAVLGLSMYARLHERAEEDDLPSRRYITPLTLFIAVSACLAAILPKAPAVWADPFHSGGPASRLLGGGQGSEKFIGYQETSAHLGGPFQINQTPVMEVTTNAPQYLRGRVYDTYTGKGWTSSDNYLKTPLLPNTTLDWTGAFGISGAPTKTVSQTVHILGGLDQVDTVFGAYVMRNAKLVKGTSSSIPQVDPYTLHVSADWDQKGSTYVVQSQELEDPSVLLSGLSPLPPLAQREALYPADISNNDLQLPSTLPGDVKTLTSKLVAEDRTEYDVVETVLNYLKGTYTYKTQGVPVPTGKQDYVEQFLFQSKVGYCNNFSSAMAVMLRTEGIPTRWVTGFTSGSFDTQDPGSNSDNYLIRESDAHSWVEVYFPSVGWIPFDPTPNYDFNYLSTATKTTPTPVPTQHHHTPPQTKPKPASTTGPVVTIDWSNVVTVLLYVIVLLFALALVGMIVFRRRVRVALYLHAWPKDEPHGLTKAMLSIFRLARKDGRLAGVATVRELASYAADYEIDVADYHHLVKTAERQLYSGKDAHEDDIRRARRTWSSWIRHILGRNH